MCLNKFKKLSAAVMPANAIPNTITNFHFTNNLIVNHLNRVWNKTIKQLILTDKTIRLLIICTAQ